MGSDIPDLHEPQMTAEYDAWQRFVAEWRACPPLAGIDLNDSDITPVVHAIEVWGERLVALRMKQTRDERQRAIDDKTAAYVQVRRAAEQP